MQDLIAVIDADDVVLKTGSTKLDYMRQHFPHQGLIARIQPYECSRTALVPIVGLKFYEEMNAFIKSREGTLRTPALEGALRGIQELSELIQVNVLSARTPEETEFAREWLEKYGALPYVARVSSAEDPKYDGVPKISGKKKVDVALHLGAVLLVDDDERHMPEKQFDGLHSLLFGEGERKNTPQHITVARNWVEVVAYAQKLVPMPYL